jgi:hypothetical protein
MNYKYWYSFFESYTLEQLLSTVKFIAKFQTDEEAIRTAKGEPINEELFSIIYNVLEDFLIDKGVKKEELEHLYELQIT